MKYTKLILTVLVFLFSSAASAEIRAVCGLFSKESSPYYLHMYQPLRFTESGGQVQAVAKFQFRTFPELETQLIVKESRVNNRLKWTYTLQTVDRNGQILRTGWRRPQPEYANKHTFRYQGKGYSVQCDSFVKYVAGEVEPTGIDLERRRLAGGDPLLRKYEENTADADIFELFTQMYELPGAQNDQLRAAVGELNRSGFFRQLFSLEDLALSSGVVIVDNADERLTCRSPLAQGQTCKVVSISQGFVFTEKLIGSDGEPAHYISLDIEIVRDQTGRIVRYLIQRMKRVFEEVPPKGGANTSGGRIMP